MISCLCVCASFVLINAISHACLRLRSRILRCYWTLCKKCSRTSYGTCPDDEILSIWTLHQLSVKNRINVLQNTGLPKAWLHECVFICKCNDIVAFSPPGHTETMKTIMKTQTYECAIQLKGGPLSYTATKKWG